MTRWVLDSSIALQWYLEDEEDRDYALSLLTSLRHSEAVVPDLWTYEVSNALVMAYRRKRLTAEQVEEILGNLRKLPIATDRSNPDTVMQLPSMALKYELTVYDAAYLQLALRLGLPIGTKDKALKRAMSLAGVALSES